MKTPTLSPLVPPAAVAVGFALYFAGLGANEAKLDETPAAVEVVSASEVEWTPLNPARGDNSPQAGTLYGNRAGLGPTGFLVKFADGFSSPAHIHNVTYRGMVISGLVHNDDPDAAELWMTKGSFWTQPAGESHITAAQGPENIAFIEIESGPYLVQPAENASDNGERPINVHASNLVWLDASDVRSIELPEKSDPKTGPKVAFLWGSPATDDENGLLLELPAGFEGELTGLGEPLQAVVIEGAPVHSVAGKAEAKPLESGSLFRSKGNIAHQLLVGNDANALLYIRVSGAFALKATNGLN